jgi:general secretion pathway protein E
MNSTCPNGNILGHDVHRKVMVVTNHFSPSAESRTKAFFAYLLEQGLLSRETIARVEAACSLVSRGPEDTLLQMGILAESKLADSLCTFCSLPRASAEEFPVELPEAEVLPHSFLRTHELLVLSLDEDTIILATGRPLQDGAARGLALFVGRRLVLKVGTVSEIKQRLSQLLDEQATSDAQGHSVEAREDDLERLKDFAREAPVVRLVSRALNCALERGASDIHIECQEDRLRIRFRVDGVLQDWESLPKSFQPGVISRVKVLAKLNITERRLPQDGRFRVPIGGREIDIRVSTIPSIHGEGVVLRFLNQKDVALSFGSLGFSEPAVAEISSLIAAPNGIVLVTGPTGSGKTTTLYAALSLLNQEDRKIITAEDPVEYHVPGCVQVPVSPAVGLDFARVLRSILRQDPDVIMVGEIRDEETARIAVQAALTGHLVLSTLHTNSAAGALTRLIEMGVEDYLLVSTVRGVIAQRLVRRLCSECRRELIASPPGWPGERCFEGQGCSSCFGKGYRGRTVLYELMPMSSSLASLVLGSATQSRLEEAARRHGLETFRECAIRKVTEGETSVAEAFRVLGTGL